jgi:UDP-3-O-[3-hydroxymyristoyl] glucosamine N-acyltransferase
MEIRIDDLLKELNAIKFIGDSKPIITELTDLLSGDEVFSHQLFWCNKKNAERLETLSAGTAIVSEETANAVKNRSINLIVTDNPRASFKTVLELYFRKKIRFGYVSKSAVISESSVPPTDVYIGEHVVIEENCIIGSKVSIGNNTVIHAGTIIENNVIIGCNNTIGGVGFVYEQNESGDWEVMPHIGNVVIDEGVEIGNNTCIDRAVLGSTYIGRNVKIDNLVHIAHGVKIKQNALIIANAMIAGSAIIEENTWVGPSASVINKGVVGKDAFIGMSAVVIKPVEANTVVAGNPAKFFRKNIEK